MKKICDTNELLRLSGVEYSPNRNLVLRIVSGSGKTLTPKSILTAVRKKRSIDKVTIYRILDLFVRKKILCRIASLDGVMHYEIVCNEHHPAHPHFVCRDCGDMECLDDIDLKGLKKKIKQKSKFLKGDIDFKLEGTCAKCVSP